MKCQAIKRNGKPCRQCGTHVLQGFCHYHKKLRPSHNVDYDKPYVDTPENPDYKSPPKPTQPTNENTDDIPIPTECFDSLLPKQTPPPPKRPPTPTKDLDAWDNIWKEAESLGYKLTSTRAKNIWGWDTLHYRPITHRLYFKCGKGKKSQPVLHLEYINEITNEIVKDKYHIFKRPIV